MFHNIYSKSKNTLKFSLGFSLVEMMVSISILVLVMTVILARQDAFDNAVLLRNQAYSIALEAREVQLYSVSVTGEGSNFRSTFGLHFDTTDGSVYKIFKDNDDDFYYDADEEFGQQGVLDPRFTIGAIRVDGTPKSALSVVFERPNFDAHFYDSGGVLDNEKVEIDVRLVGTTEVRTIEITRTGQISVN